jgi:translation initiation factor IF-2
VAALAQDRAFAARNPARASAARSAASVEAAQAADQTPAAPGADQTPAAPGAPLTPAPGAVRASSARSWPTDSWHPAGRIGRVNPVALPPRGARGHVPRTAQALVPSMALAPRRRAHPRRLARPHFRPSGRTYPRWPFRTQPRRAGLERPPEPRMPTRDLRARRPQVPIHRPQVPIRQPPAHHDSQHRAGIGPPGAWLNGRLA